MKGKKRVDIKSTGREKERITLILGIDYLNSIKMKPFIILKGTTKRTINNFLEEKDCILSYQKNGWCNDEQFINFLSLIPDNKNILLIVDNFSSHKCQNTLSTIKEKFKHINIRFLPPNTTPILQPLDVGVNKIFKNEIKNFYMSWLVDKFNQDQTLVKLNKRDRTNLLINWIKLSWNLITSETIKKSFEFCGYFKNDTDTYKWMEYYKNI